MKSLANLLLLCIPALAADEGTVLIRAEFFRLAGEAKRGHSVLVLARKPVQWSAGDSLLIPAGGSAGHGELFAEAPEIRAIESIDGQLVYLKPPPLERDHGSLENFSSPERERRLPIAINLSRISVLREGVAR